MVVRRPHLGTVDPTRRRPAVPVPVPV